MSDISGYLDYGILGLTIMVLFIGIRCLWNHLKELTNSYRQDIKEFIIKQDDLIKEMDTRQDRRDSRQGDRDDKLNDVLRDLSTKISIR